MDFCKQYNAATQDKAGTIIPVEITVYEDRSFTFILKTPPASVLLQKAAGVEKGSGNPKTEKVGSVTRAQLREIAEGGDCVVVGALSPVGGDLIGGKEPTPFVTT